MGEKIEQPILQNKWHEIQNHLHMCYTTSRAHNELHGECETSWVAPYNSKFNNCVPKLLSY